MKKKNKNKSLVSQTIHMFVIQSALLGIVIVTYICVAYYTVLENMQTSSRNLLQLYGKELENKLENADMLLERLIYKNNDYDMLQSEKESERYYASIEIKKIIQEQITYDQYVDAVVIGDSTYGSCLDYENSDMAYQEREDLRQYALERAKEGSAKAEWMIVRIGLQNYVSKMYVWQGRSAGIFISVDHFMDNVTKKNLQKIFILLKDEQQKVWGGCGKQEFTCEIGKELQATPQSLGVYKNDYTLADGKLQLSAYVSKSQVVGQIRWNMILVLFVILILAGFSVFFINFLRREMLAPMGHMQRSMEQMQTGNREYRITKEFESNEFIVLKDAFNRLMDEIMKLKIQSYEKQIDLQETELKCIKLQIRPHFFLNAMTTISSLSQQGKNKEIESYISALSKNIRYMFRAGLHTVSLQEEVTHVENYFEMQELKYPGCVFYYIDINPEVREWKIPQMIIHTIIENEYKYAVNINQMLTILIKASKADVNGEEMLYVEVEDDGAGYPKEVLQFFENQENTISKTGERVGLKSVKRMMELMYEREGLFTISNIEPHGCKNTFRIPAHAVQEMKEQKQIKMD